MIAHMPVVDDLECIRTNPLFYSKFVTSNSYCAGFRNSNGKIATFI